MNEPRAPRTLKELLEAHEKVIIEKTLVVQGWSRTGAARALGISRMWLWRRMKVLGINAPKNRT